MVGWRPFPSIDTSPPTAKRASPIWRTWHQTRSTAVLGPQSHRPRSERPAESPSEVTQRKYVVLVGAPSLSPPRIINLEEEEEEEEEREVLRLITLCVNDTTQCPNRGTARSSTPLPDGEEIGRTDHWPSDPVRSRGR